ncbi:cation diffusion facilitator family transporter [Halovulum sp. GXIMD14794]
MGHHHHHHHAPEDGGKLLVAVLVNLGLTVAQVVGGVLAGSLALIADAVHNLSDALSLVIAWAARRIARRPADARMTFGYRRAEVVAALVNYTTLIIIGLYLLWEAVWRLFDPEPVTGWLMIAVAGVALVVDVVTALLTWRMAQTSMNIRAAFLHNLADAMGSIAVILAGLGVMAFGWAWIDSVMTLAIAGYILWMAVGGVGPAIRILMLGAPDDMDTMEVVEALRGVDGVAGVHRVRLWQVQEHEAALDTHIVVSAGRWHEADAIKARVRTLLTDRYGISDITLEVECARHACEGPELLGNGGAHA